MTESGPAGQRWYVVGLGAAVNFIVFAMAMSCLPVLFSEISGELNLSIVQVGTVWGAGSVAGIFSIFAAGILADRFGTRRILVAACLLAAVFGALRGLADGFTSLTITSLLFGLASEAVPVVVVKNTSLWFHDRGLGMAQGIVTTSVGGGIMLGAMLSATVLSPWLGGWRNVMFFYGGLSAFIGIIWWLTAPALKRPAGATDTPSVMPALKRVTRSRGVWLIALAMMGFAGGNKGVIGYLPLYLRGSGWTPAAADGALAALNAAGTATAIPLGLLSDRLGRRKAFVLPGLLVTVVSVGLLAMTTGPAVWPLAIFAGIFRDMIWAVAATMTVETPGIGPAYAGTAVGIIHSLTRVGYTFAPPAGNAFAPVRAGLPFVFWAGLSLLALVVFLFTQETGRDRQRHFAITD